MACEGKRLCANEDCRAPLVSGRSSVRYCSKACGNTSRRVPKRKCPGCGEMFQPIRPTVRSCSARCHGLVRTGGAERCRHGVMVDDCRECLPGGFTVREFVAAFPDGAELSIVGAMLGTVGERVRQIEAGALAKLGRRNGRELRDALAWFNEQANGREGSIDGSDDAASE